MDNEVVKILMPMAEQTGRIESKLDIVLSRTDKLETDMDQVNSHVNKVRGVFAFLVAAGTIAGLVKLFL